MTTSESTLRSTGKDPGPEVTCDPEEEYRHGTHCCLRCPPGTRVTQPCTAQGTLGVCAECPLGQYSHKNGLDHCWPCTRCREDQEMWAPCYRKSDARCRCKAGHYCEGPDCAACLPCRTSCPEGEELLQRCTDTADIVCGAPPTGGPDMSWLWPILIVFLVLVLIIWGVGKCRCSRARSGSSSKTLHSI
ncbi:tumor necrosis factor receptor superfamily member 23-like isoform X4 [Antechinus flavipes]|uniref:tumor necrosis factor receptor superfamily member 23-like isoform X4 n=1 Tax=Antechinus flavipes TaxID=38775 RepID=UPI002236260D|nr:tumor necrosis factor receptor superfamily member 23-like isoform X4 [Antechinus flavipes]